MAHGRLGLGMRKRAWVAAAVAAAAGCQSTDRDDSFGNLDSKTRQMLLSPAAGPVKGAEPAQFAVTDPSATGGSGVTARGAFNRGMAPAGAPAYAVVTPSAMPGMANTTGVVQAGAIGTPTMATTGGNLQLQPKVMPASMPAATAGPPVMPNQTPATSLPPANAPTVNVIGRMPAEAPIPPVIVASPTPETTPAVLNPAPAPMPPVLVAPPAPPAMPAPPPLSAPTSTLPPPLAPSPMPATGFAPLASPVDQPVAGLAPLAPTAPLK